MNYINKIKEYLSDQMNHEVLNFIQKIKIYSDLSYQKWTADERLKLIDKTTDKISDLVFLYQNLFNPQYFTTNINSINTVYNNIVCLNIQNINQINRSIFEVTMLYLIWIGKNYSIEITQINQDIHIRIPSNPTHINYYLSLENTFCNFSDTLKILTKFIKVELSDNNDLILKRK